MFLVSGKYQLGHLTDRERGRATQPWHLSQTEVPLERGTSVQGLHAGRLFWKTTMGTGWETVGGETWKEGKRTGECDA